MVRATGAKKFTSKVSCRIADETVLVQFMRAPGGRIFPFQQDGCIVDQDVQFAVSPFEVIADGSMVLRLGDVAAEAFGCDAFGAEHCCGGFAIFRFTRTNHNYNAKPTEFSGRLQSEAPIGPRDECDSLLRAHLLESVSIIVAQSARQAWFAFSSVGDGTPKVPNEKWDLPEPPTE